MNARLSVNVNIIALFCLFTLLSTEAPIESVAHEPVE